MKDIPQKIYLQVGDEVPDDISFNDLSTQDISWCDDRVFKNDIEYIRFDDIKDILSVVADRWGGDYGGSTVGIIGKKAKELLDENK